MYQLLSIVDVTLGLHPHPPAWFCNPNGSSRAGGQRCGIACEGRGNCILSYSIPHGCLIVNNNDYQFTPTLNLPWNLSILLCQAAAALTAVHGTEYVVGDAYHTVYPSKCTRSWLLDVRLCSAGKGCILSQPFFPTATFFLKFYFHYLYHLFSLSIYLFISPSSLGWKPRLDIWRAEDCVFIWTGAAWYGILIYICKRSKWPMHACVHICIYIYMCVCVCVWRALNLFENNLPLITQGQVRVSSACWANHSIRRGDSSRNSCGHAVRSTTPNTSFCRG